MLDAAIIGTGPAGQAAVLTLKLHSKSFVWFGSAARSQKVGRSECIANYPGLGMISGSELNRRFEAQCREMEIAVTDKMVTNIVHSSSSYLLLADNEMYEARTLLLAVGAVTARGFAGEAELLGHGVSYCATCDGFLYKGKTIAVFCGSKRYEHEVEYLAGLAAGVWVSSPYSGAAFTHENITLLPSPLKAINGDRHVSGITLTDGQSLAVDGVFVLRDAVAPALLLPGLEMDGPHICVDRRMQTNLPGCYAAGDCTGRPYQIAKAVGEGNVAAHSMIEALTQTERTKQ